MDAGKEGCHDNRQIHLRITGMVQGVCYRAWAQETAEALGLAGWVRNRHDGSVEIVAEGQELTLAKFAAACRMGPALARVTDVKIEYSDATGEFHGFDVTF